MATPERLLELVGLHAGSFIPARYDTVGIYQHLSASQTLVDSTTIRASLDVPCTPGEVAAERGVSVWTIYKARSRVLARQGTFLRPLDAHTWRATSR